METSVHRRSTNQLNGAGESGPIRHKSMKWWFHFGWFFADHFRSSLSWQLEVCRLSMNEYSLDISTYSILLMVNLISAILFLSRIHIFPTFLSVRPSVCHSLSHRNRWTQDLETFPNWLDWVKSVNIFRETNRTMNSGSQEVHQSWGIFIISSFVAENLHSQKMVLLCYLLYCLFTYLELCAIQYCTVYISLLLWRIICNLRVRIPLAD